MFHLKATFTRLTTSDVKAEDEFIFVDPQYENARLTELFMFLSKGRSLESWQEAFY